MTRLSYERRTAAVTTGPPSARSVTVLGECVADAFADPARSASGSGELGGARQHGRGPGPAGTPTRFLGRFSQDAFGTLFHTRLTSPTRVWT